MNESALFTVFAIFCDTSVTSPSSHKKLESPLVLISVDDIFKHFNVFFKMLKFFD